MPIYFKSLRSSSNGNCLLLWTENTKVVIDCGLGSMRRTKALLEENFSSPKEIDAVIISHLHTDHISYYPLRVLEEYGCPVRVHRDCLEHLREKHFNRNSFESLHLKPFSTREFKVGELKIKPFEIPHQPYYPTFGFVVKYKKRIIVIATDFNTWEDSLDHFIDADFIFVESNHNLELLKLYFNPNSLFHMSNPEAGRLLCNARKLSRKAPEAVMLGHISSQRNEADIAIEEVRNSFGKEGIKVDFELCAAPLYEESAVVELG